MDPVTLAIMASGGNLLSSGINYFSQQETNEFNERATRETNAMNSSIAQENRDWQERMWNKTNEYNSPVAQMSRLRDAGLNPMLAYGSLGDGKAIGIGSPAMAHYDAPHNEAPQFGGDNPVATYYQVKNLAAMNALRNAEITKAQSEAISAAAKARYDAYESDSLIKSGTTRADSAWIKTPMRAASILWDTGKFYGRKLINLNQSIVDKVTTPAIMKSIDFGRTLFGYHGTDEMAHQQVGR